MKNNAKLSPPWITHYRKIEALFEQDPEIKISYNEEKNELKLFVEDAAKAAALQKLLPPIKHFGNVDFKINIVPANKLTSASSLLCTAFAGNPVLKDIIDTQSVLGNFTYAVFDKKVVQFFDDRLDDVNGNYTTLYQDIAKDVLELTDQVFFCTAQDENECNKCCSGDFDGDDDIPY